jgi:hypothetical protein
LANAELPAVDGVLDGVVLVAHAGRTVEGVVTKLDGSAHAFGEIRFRVRDLGITGVEKADQNGHFTVAGLPLDHDVELWAEGNATGAWGARVVGADENTVALTYIAPAY